MSDDPTTTPRRAASVGSVPERLMAFLDRLGAVLADRGDAVALLGLGSVGRDLHRLDEHSDADFFVVVDDAAARQRYLDDLDWLDAAQPIVWSFENSPVGRKALLEGGLFAEYAVFSLSEMATAGYPPGRVHWQRADAPAGLETPTAPLPGTPRLEEQVGEAITNLYVGLHRDLRGERLTATALHPGVCRRPLGHDPRPARAGERAAAGRLRHRPWSREALRTRPAATGRPRARLRAERACGTARCWGCWSGTWGWIRACSLRCVTCWHRLTGRLPAAEAASCQSPRRGAGTVPRRCGCPQCGTRVEARSRRPSTTLPSSCRARRRLLCR